MMIKTSFYTLVIPILFSLLTVIYTADPADPCPSGADLTNIVADMCTDVTTEEDNASNGGKDVDSVLLRIIKQQNNCICHVSLANDATNYTIYMSKYGELSKSAPVQSNCGLAVDVEYQETSESTRSLQSIECTSGTSIRAIVLGGSELKFTSRIIGDNFTRGYCMQIFRNQTIQSCEMKDQEGKAGLDEDWIKTSGDHHNSLAECKRYCMLTEACVAVNYITGHSYCFVYNRTTSTQVNDASIYSEKHCVDTQRLKIKCQIPDSNTITIQRTTPESTINASPVYPSEMTTKISQGTTTEDNQSTKSNTVTTAISNTPQSTMLTEKKSTKDKNSDLYVYIGAGAGGLFMMLLIVCIIVCIRKRINQTPQKESKNDSTKQFCREDRDSDNDYGGLKDNVLYVSSEPTELLEDGNYNTVDLEQSRKVNQDINFDGNYSTVDGICSNSSLSKPKPVIKPKPNSSLKRASDEETIHLSKMDNCNNEYAVVDKGRNSDAVIHINPDHGNGTEYAVVNKIKRSSNNN